MTFVVEAEPPWMEPLRYTSWTRMRRVTAWVMRFIRNLRAKVKREDRLASKRHEGQLLTPGGTGVGRKSVGTAGAGREVR